jgi:hypothetical protein
MRIKINGIEITAFTNLNLNLVYNSVRSDFAFSIYWNPQDPKLRGIMLPGSYAFVSIIGNDGTYLLTGSIIAPAFKDSPTPTLVTVSGYSLTGVLADCEYSALFDSSQTNGLTLLQICKNVCAKFGISVIDKTNGTAAQKRVSNTGGTALSSVSAYTNGSASAEQEISQTAPEHNQKCNDYIAEIAGELNIVLGHDGYGNLVLSVASDTPPIYNFDGSNPNTELNLSFDGSQMHSSITAVSQGGTGSGYTVYNPYVAPQSGFSYQTFANNQGLISAKSKYAGGLNVAAAANNQKNLLAVANANTSTGILSALQNLQILNDYSVGYRPTTVTQKNTDSENLQQTAYKALARELENVDITVYFQGWQLNNKYPKPGDFVMIKSPKCYLFKAAKFIIQSVIFAGDEKQQTAVLKCMLPECFNGELPIKSVFYDNNWDVYEPNILDTGAHVVPTPFI